MNIYIDEKYVKLRVFQNFYVKDMKLIILNRKWYSIELKNVS